MRHLTSKEYAEENKIPFRHVQKMYKQGDIKDDRKEERPWMIPIEDKNILPFPIGISDYKSASDNYYYVDKTLMIKDILDDKPMVSLFTRPRGFGKSLNMDMLRVFFEISDEDTSVYFRDKKIWKCGEHYTKHQGKYPVVFLTFKDVKCDDWKSSFHLIHRIISEEFERHLELLNSIVLSSYDKDYINKILAGNASECDLEFSLLSLSRLLSLHYGVNPIIIVDDYDTPSEHSFLFGYYDKMSCFLINLLSGAFKDNHHLFLGFMTGIQRTPKGSIYGGLNNIKVYSILDSKYSSYFGFVKEEVEEMLSYYGIENKEEEVWTWYGGYRFCNLDIYNPWSVINYISDGMAPHPYWHNTGRNEIIGEVLSKASLDITKGLESLLNGEKVTTFVDTDVIYPEIEDNPYSVYSFLLLSGYLKIDKLYPQFRGSCMCDVRIPNKEIAYVYEKEIINTIEKRY